MSRSDSFWEAGRKQLESVRPGKGWLDKLIALFYRLVLRRDRPADREELKPESGGEVYCPTKDEVDRSLFLLG